MDPKTLLYYSKNAQEAFNKYESAKGGIEKYFKQAFPQKGLILDIGAGSGRDVRHLIKEGHEAYALEPSDELRALTIRKYPELTSRIMKGFLPNGLTSVDKKFDGVICSAVLMHIPKEHIFDSVFSIKRILKKDGRALISIPIDRKNLNQERRDDKERLFTDITAEYLELLFERIGFKFLQKWKDEDSLGRKDVSWATLLFQLVDVSQSRPIDQIESVLNRDKKVATYKLALFRALCEISMTGFQRVRWFPNGTVGIPLEDVCEKWIYYYWPLFETSSFIPQIQGEHKNCAKPIAFRGKFENLIANYAHSGGLSGFTVDLRNENLSSEIRPLIKKLYTSLKNTITKGPVTYSGSSLSTGRLFEYEPQQQLIIFNADIWKEISLMSHWILDALILRWAELTARLSKDVISPSEVINLLLVNPLPEREVSLARSIYRNLRSVECVWSGKIIEKFDIDHVIPFSFWRNNDLWNLMPSQPRLNLQKKDKLPSHKLLLRRKDAIIYYWQILREKSEPRFDFEARKILGREKLARYNWEFPLFSALAEAVEVTALQRGCDRWEFK
jgi:SAM-dependent methyltransferase